MSGIELIPAALVHAELLAGMHAVCFAEPWTSASMAGSLAMPGARGLIAVAGDSLAPSEGGETGPAGLVLWRLALDEAEILTIAVLPPWRRRGLGDRLMRAVLTEAAAAGAATMFLEVADGNEPALALYTGLGFDRIGRRKGYYGPIDAIVMMRKF